MSLAQRYRAVHRTGQDCRVTSARNLLELYGYRHSYATVQGLSSSFFFTYRKSFSPLDKLTFRGGNLCKYFWPVSGQRMDVLENLAYLFNASLIVREDQTSDEAEADMLTYIRAGLPVMVAISRHALATHLKKEYGYPPFFRGMRFGGHFVMVVEADEARRVATIFDTDHQEVIELPFDVLAKVRCEGDGDPDCFLQSRNRWAVFLPAGSVPSIKQAMASSLVRVVHNFRSAAKDPACTGGMTGLVAFCREVPSWQELAADDVDKLRATIFMMCMQSELISGGSLGRRPFGVFLRQAGEAMRESRILEAASHYAELTELWKKLFRILEIHVMQSDEVKSLRTPEVLNMLSHISDHEFAAFSKLEDSMI